MEQTELQQSIFNAPPPGSAPVPSGLPAKPSPAVDSEMKDADNSDNRGQKRTRDEEEDESEEDVAMEEDSDDE